MLAGDRCRAAAVDEVCHELMHAVQQGLTWPDEYFVGNALAAEVRREQQ